MVHNLIVLLVAFVLLGVSVICVETHLRERRIKINKFRNFLREKKIRFLRIRDNPGTSRFSLFVTNELTGSASVSRISGRRRDDIQRIVLGSKPIVFSSGKEVAPGVFEIYCSDVVPEDAVSAHPS